MLEVKNLNKSFGNNNVISGLSFKLDKGEVGVLFGKSGVGKTTVLRCLNGLETFDSGEIIIDDEVIKKSKDISRIRHSIGMVFQNFNLFPHMSVLENIIEAPVNILKTPKSYAISKAKELLEIVDLSDKINAYPHELSGGQQQRVAIARACSLTPRVLCFDEPTSALDSESIARVSKIIKNLKLNGMTILIITHDKIFADEIHDKIIPLGINTTQ